MHSSGATPADHLVASMIAETLIDIGWAIPAPAIMCVKPYEVSIELQPGSYKTEAITKETSLTNGYFERIYTERKRTR